MKAWGGDLVSDDNDKPDDKRPVVFISYAHESDEFRRAVQQLVVELRRHCIVISDHDHPHRPPPEGWHAWMQKSIKQASVVLVVCSPKLRHGYEKTGEQGTGRGVTWEGAIITREIYDNNMQNDKFFPVIPDDGSQDDVPDFLAGWFNYNRFPSGTHGIVRLVLNDDPPASPPPSGRPEAAGAPTEQDHLDAQSRFASESLSKVTNSSFSRQLQQTVSELWKCQTLEEVVPRFSACPANQVADLLAKLRKALERSEPTARDADVPQAAAALAVLAGSRAVTSEAVNAVRDASDQQAYLIRCAGEHPLLCALLLVAALDVVAEVSFSLEAAVPTDVVPLEPSKNTELPLHDLRRAAHVALFRDLPNTPTIAQQDGPFPDDLHSLTKAEISYRSKEDQRAVGFIVDRVIGASYVEQFATEVGATTFVHGPKNELTWFAIDPNDLLARLRLVGHAIVNFRNKRRKEGPKG